MTLNTVTNGKSQGGRPIRVILATSYVLAGLAVHVAVVLGVFAFVAAQDGHRRRAWTLLAVAVALPAVGYAVQVLSWKGVF